MTCSRASNPRLIYLALKGFLPGPYEARPFLDELAQMSAGLAFMTGPRGKLLRAGASIVDVGAAAYGVIAVLAALQQRARTGAGQKITSGLYETTVFWMAQWLAQYAATGEPSVPMPEIRQGTRMGWGVYQLFTAGTASKSSSASPPTATGSASARSSGWTISWPTST